VVDDPYRSITRTWYGRVFKFEFVGAASQALTWWLLIPALLIASASLSVLLVHKMAPMPSPAPREDSDSA
ncbi:MAG: hypothetical protein ACR2RV_18515, partial [Verrucomicrobiales bacterium]